jgi:hypothetical protein
MAFSASILSDSTRGRNAISVGPLKIQVMTYTCVSTDTSGTVTAPGLIEITAIHVDGLVQTTAATFAANVATLAFNAPGGTTVAGTITVYGI